MAGQNTETMASQMEPDTTDPWAAAFAALDQEEQANAEAATDDDAVHGGEQGDLPGPEGNDAGEGTPAPEAGDGGSYAGEPGGPSDLPGETGGQDGDLDWIGIDLSEQEVASYKESFSKEIRERAIRDVAAAYVKQGARNTNGALGASINDPDVCKRDRDGVPRFYNPETGREFTGDNPRRQAQEWVDDYNRELSDAFNKTCQEYEQRLLKQEGGRLAIIEFAPKYKALDPVRRSMFESIIEDYEITDDNGDIVGYTCDLDKALAAVNRQVRMIQQRFSKSETAKPAPSGPALDTPSTTGNAGGKAKPQFKSIEEAMEWEQDQLLEKMRNKKGAR